MIAKSRIARSCCGIEKNEKLLNVGGHDRMHDIGRVRWWMDA